MGGTGEMGPTPVSNKRIIKERAETVTESLTVREYKANMADQKGDGRSEERGNMMGDE